jgi:hypothetical protein
MLIAARQHKDDHWSHSRNDPLPPNYTKPRTVTAPPAVTRTARTAAVADPIPEPANCRGARPISPPPSPRRWTTWRVATEPETPSAVTPFLTTLDDALSDATPVREPEAPVSTLPRRRASDALPGPQRPTGRSGAGADRGRFGRGARQAQQIAQRRRVRGDHGAPWP